MTTDLLSTIVTVIYGFGILQAVLVLVVLQRKSASSNSVKWLSYLLLAITAVLFHHGFYINMPVNEIARYYFNGLAAAVWFTVPVCFYFYIYSLFASHKTIYKAQYLLFIPAVYHLVTWLFAWAGYYLPWGRWMGEYIRFYDVIWVGSYVALGLWCSFRVSRLLARNATQNDLSDEVRWLRGWNFGFAAALIITLIALLLLVLFNQYGVLFEYSLLTVYAAFTLGLAYNAMTRTKYAGWLGHQQYGQAAKDNSELEQLYQELEDHVRLTTPHLNPDLRRSDLAAAIKVSEHVLGQVFTQHLKSNFYHYVNEHRLRSFEKMLTAGALNELSIAGLARVCGFRSKTSLYRVFREKHGMTPRAWLKSQEVTQT